MKIEKFKVLIYLKRSGTDKNGKTPIMGRITVNRSVAQFSCKLNCSEKLWNPRESRLNGKSKEAVETNAKIDRLLVSIHKAFDTLVERKTDFDAVSVKNLFQGGMDSRMTLLKLFDRHIEEVKSLSVWNIHYERYPIIFIRGNDLPNLYPAVIRFPILISDN